MSKTEVLAFLKKEYPKKFSLNQLTFYIKTMNRSNIAVALRSLKKRNEVNFEQSQYLPTNKKPTLIYWYKKEPIWNFWKKAKE